MARNKCEECGNPLKDESRQSVQMYGGAWEDVCIDCAIKLKKDDMLGAAMDDVDFELIKSINK